jgi:hypothetical protein
MKILATGRESSRKSVAAEEDSADGALGEWLPRSDADSMMRTSLHSDQKDLLIIYAKAAKAICPTARARAAITVSQRSPCNGRQELHRVVARCKPRKQSRKRIREGALVALLDQVPVQFRVRRCHRSAGPVATLKAAWPRQLRCPQMT